MSYRQGYSGGTGGQYQSGGTIDVVGQVIVYKGDWIDGVVLAPPGDAPPLSVASLVGSKASPPNMTTAKLEKGEYIVAISGTFGSVINSLVVKIQGGAEPRELTFVGGKAGDFQFQYVAPSEYCICGLFGRTGGSVDAIGVIYSAIPKS